MISESSPKTNLVPTSLCLLLFINSYKLHQVGRGFNRDKWNELEQYCRSLARSHRNVYVCTGPLFLPRQEDDGLLYVRYRVLGDNHVAVPTHFFKVILAHHGAHLQFFRGTDLQLFQGTDLQLSCRV